MGHFAPVAYPRATAPGFEGKALGYEGISEGVTGEELPIDPDRKAREDGGDYPELRA